MIDIFTYTDIVEADVRILNPLSNEKLQLLGSLAGLAEGDSVLDLACGKGELLCQFALNHAISGVGIDIHPPFISAATARATSLGVANRLDFRAADGAVHGESRAFDAVACLGATFIGGGFAGCLELMRSALRTGGTMLVGEPFAEQPHLRPASSPTLGLDDVLARIAGAGFELTDFVAASRDDWDRYAARHWAAAHEWALANSSNPLAAEIKAWTSKSRTEYLTNQRSWLGWGVFVLRDPR